MLWSCGSQSISGGFHKANTTESRLYCTSAFPITLCQAKLCQDAWIRWGPGTGMREIRKTGMLWNQWKPWNHDIQNVALNFEGKTYILESNWHPTSDTSSYQALVWTLGKSGPIGLMGPFATAPRSGALAAVLLVALHIETWRNSTISRTNS